MLSQLHSQNAYHNSCVRAKLHSEISTHDEMVLIYIVYTLTWPKPRKFAILEITSPITRLLLPGL